MTGETKRDQITPEDVDQNPGVKMASVNSDPAIVREEARNAAAGEEPNSAGSVSPSDAEGFVPSTSDPNPTNIPSTDHPLPDEVDPDASPEGASTGSTDEDKYVH